MATTTPRCPRCGEDPHERAAAAADRLPAESGARKVISELQTERDRLKHERNELAYDLETERRAGDRRYQTRRTVRELLPKVRDELERHQPTDTVIDRVRVDELLVDIDDALRSWR